MVSASGVSNILILLSDPKQLCNRKMLLLQEKQAENKFEKNQEIVAINDKILEYQCKSKKQHKQFLIKCNLL